MAVLGKAQASTGVVVRLRRKCHQVFKNNAAFFK